MISLSKTALETLSTHHGIITTDQLRASGVPRAAWQRMSTAGVLIPLHKGVYRIASTPETTESSCVAVCAAHARGFITGPTGGTITGLRRMPKNSLIHFSVPHGLELPLDVATFKLRQSRRIERTDVQIRADGIRLASPWRLAFDLAADLSSEDHASVVEQILHMGLCGIGALALTARRLAHPSRPGSKQFVATLASRLPGGPLESHPEVRIAKALQERGVPIHAQTTWLLLPDGRTIRLDLSVPDIRWGVEVDIHFSHLLLAGTASDKSRDRQARLRGWQTDRITDLDMLDMDGLLDELVQLYEVRRAEIELQERQSG